MFSLWDIPRLYILSGLLFCITRHLKRLKAFNVCCETIVCFLTFIFSSPVLLVFLCGNFIVRTFLTLYFRLIVKNVTRENPQGDRILLMGGNDAFWAYDEFANSSNFTSLLVMEGECNLANIRKLYSERIVDKVINGERFYDVFRRRA